MAIIERSVSVALIPKARANYRATQSTTVHCTDCVHVQEHGAGASTCDEVAGTVDGQHVCDYFQPDNRSAMSPWPTGTLPIAGNSVVHTDGRTGTVMAFDGADMAHVNFGGRVEIVPLASLKSHGDKQMGQFDPSTVKLNHGQADKPGVTIVRSWKEWDEEHLPSGHFAKTAKEAEAAHNWGEAGAAAAHAKGKLKGLLGKKSKVQASEATKSIGNGKDHSASFAAKSTPKKTYTPEETAAYNAKKAAEAEVQRKADAAYAASRAKFAGSYLGRDLHAEGAWEPQSHKSRYGAVMLNTKGHVLLREPTGHFDGNAWTFPKGHPDRSEHPTTTAIRETEEETGLTPQIVGHVPGSFGGSSTGSVNHYYLSHDSGNTFDPKMMNGETQKLVWATPEQADAMIAQGTNAAAVHRDRSVLRAAVVAHEQAFPEVPKSKPLPVLPPLPPPPPKPAKSAYNPSTFGHPEFDPDFGYKGVWKPGQKLPGEKRSQVVASEIETRNWKQWNEEHPWEAATHGAKTAAEEAAAKKWGEAGAAAEHAKHPGGAVKPTVKTSAHTPSNDAERKALADRFTKEAKSIHGHSKDSDEAKNFEDSYTQTRLADHDAGTSSADAHEASLQAQKTANVAPGPKSQAIMEGEAAAHHAHSIGFGDETPLGDHAPQASMNAAQVTDLKDAADEAKPTQGVKVPAAVAPEHGAAYQEAHANGLAKGQSLAAQNKTPLQIKQSAAVNYKKAKTANLSGDTETHASQLGFAHGLNAASNQHAANLKGGGSATSPAVDTSVHEPSADIAKPVVAPVGHLGDSTPKTTQDLAYMKEITGPKGTNPAQWYKANDGSRYLVKSAVDDDHAENEVATGAVFAAAGIKAPETRVITDEKGNKHVVSKGMDDLTSWNKTNVPLSARQADARKGFGIDALTSNYDALGHVSVKDNSLIDKEGQVVRIDQGGGGFFRAQGLPKGDGFAAGKAWKDPETLRSSEQGKILYGAHEGAHEDEIQASLQAAKSLDLGKVKQTMLERGVSEPFADKYLAVLKDRQNQLKDKESQAPPSKAEGYEQGQKLAKTSLANGHDSAHVHNMANAFGTTADDEYTKGVVEGMHEVAYDNEAPKSTIKASQSLMGNIPEGGFTDADKVEPLAPKAAAGLPPTEKATVASLKTGDKVLAYNSKTQAMEPHTVLSKAKAENKMTNIALKSDVTGDIKGHVAGGAYKMDKISTDPYALNKSQIDAEHASLKRNPAYMKAKNGVNAEYANNEWSASDAAHNAKVSHNQAVSGKLPTGSSLSAEDFKAHKFGSADAHAEAALAHGDTVNFPIGGVASSEAIAKQAKPKHEPLMISAKDLKVGDKFQHTPSGFVHTVVASGEVKNSNFQKVATYTAELGNKVEDFHKDYEVHKVEEAAPTMPSHDDYQGGHSAGTSTAEKMLASGETPEAVHHSAEKLGKADNQYGQGFVDGLHAGATKHEAITVQTSIHEPTEGPQTKYLKGSPKYKEFMAAHESAISIAGSMGYTPEQAEQYAHDATVTASKLNPSLEKAHHEGVAAGYAEHAIKQAQGPKFLTGKTAEAEATKPTIEPSNHEGGSTTIEHRKLENHEGTSNKFYESKVEKSNVMGYKHITSYGSTKPGAHVTTNETLHTSEESALAAHNGIVKAKMLKGYEDVPVPGFVTSPVSGYNLDSKEHDAFMASYEQKKPGVNEGHAKAMAEAAEKNASQPQHPESKASYEGSAKMWHEAAQAHAAGTAEPPPLYMHQAINKAISEGYDFNGEFDKKKAWASDFGSGALDNELEGHKSDRDLALKNGDHMKAAYHAASIAGIEKALEEKNYKTESPSISSEPKPVKVPKDIADENQNSYLSGHSHGHNIGEDMAKTNKTPLQIKQKAAPFYKDAKIAKLAGDTTKQASALGTAHGLMAAGNEHAKGDLLKDQFAEGTHGVGVDGQEASTTLDLTKHADSDMYAENYKVQAGMNDNKTSDDIAQHLKLMESQYGKSNVKVQQDAYAGGAAADVDSLNTNKAHAPGASQEIDRGAKNIWVHDVTGSKWEEFPNGDMKYTKKDGQVLKYAGAMAQEKKEGIIASSMWTKVSGPPITAADVSAPSVVTSSTPVKGAKTQSKVMAKNLKTGDIIQNNQGLFVQVAQHPHGSAPGSISGKQVMNDGTVNMNSPDLEMPLPEGGLSKVTKLTDSHQVIKAMKGEYDSVVGTGDSQGIQSTLKPGGIKAKAQPVKFTSDLESNGEPFHQHPGYSNEDYDKAYNAFKATSNPTNDDLAAADHAQQSATNGTVESAEAKGKFNGLQAAQQEWAKNHKSEAKKQQEKEFIEKVKGSYTSKTPFEVADDSSLTVPNAIPHGTKPAHATAASAVGYDQAIAQGYDQATAAYLSGKTPEQIQGAVQDYLAQAQALGEPSDEAGVIGQAHLAGLAQGAGKAAVDLKKNPDEHPNASGKSVISQGVLADKSGHGAYKSVTSGNPYKDNQSSTQLSFNHSELEAVGTWKHNYRYGGGAFVSALNKIGSGKDPGTSEAAKKAKKITQMYVEKAEPNTQAMQRKVKSSSVPASELAAWTTVGSDIKIPLTSWSTDPNAWSGDVWLHAPPGTVSLDIGRVVNYESEVETIGGGHFKVLKVVKQGSVTHVYLEQTEAIAS